MEGRTARHRRPHQVPTRAFWILIALMLIGLRSSAEAISCNDDVRITGTITAVDPGLRQITVDAQTFATDNDTEFEDDLGNVISFEEFPVGAAVRVDYCPDSGNPPIAENFKLLEPTGQTPTPTGTPNPTTTATPTTTGTPDPSTTVTPTVTGTPDDNNDCDQQVEGFVSAVDPTEGILIISGVIILTDQRTLFEDREENVLTIASFRVGDKAEAEGCFKQSGALLARKVELKESSNLPTFTPSPTPDPSSTATPIPTQISGNNCGNDVESIISAIDAAARTITIGATIVRTDSRTRFEDAVGNHVTFSYFQVGDAAEADGCFQPDGSLLARKVEVQSTTSPTPTVVPTGTPDGIGNHNCAHEVESYLAFVDVDAQTMIIGGVIVITDARTIFEDRDDNSLTFGDFVLGDKVEAEGCFQPDGTLLAKKIELKVRAGSTPTPTPTPSPTPDPDGTPLPSPTPTATPDRDLTVFGVIDSINPIDSSIIVEGLTFVVGETTEIEARNDARLTFADLRIDMRVSVEGDAIGVGIYQAREIKVQEENVVGGNGQHLVGTVSAIDLPTSLTIDGGIVDLTGNPIVSNFDGASVTLENIAIGDLIDVEGLPQTNGALRATTIEVRASVLSSLDAANNRLTASNTNVILTPATEYKDAANSAITLADFVIGDLIKVEGVYNGLSVTASEIKLVSPLTFSPKIGNLDSTTPSTDNGVASLRSTSNNLTFGFVDLPANSFANIPNSLYEVRMNIGTDVADRALVPVARVRSNMSDFQKAQEYVVTSTEDGRFSPTLEGKEYTAYFVPSRTDLVAPDWYSAMDLLNFIGTDSVSGALFMNAISATPIEFSRLRVAEVVYEESFSTNGHGWSNGGATPLLDLPDFSWNSGKGALQITPRNATSFGFWDRQTGVTVQPSTLYRARFVLSSDCATRDVVPTMRGRLNLASYQLASVTVIESVGTADESPLSEPRIYDVYLYIPGTPRAGDTLLAGWDVLAVDPENAVDTPVYLEHFTLERLQILP